MPPVVHRFDHSPADVRWTAAPCGGALRVPRDRQRAGGLTLRLLLLTSLLGTGIACGGGGGDGPGTTEPPPATPGTLSVSVSPTAGTATVGGSASATVTVTRGGSFTGPVTLAATGLTTGITASFDPATVPAGSTTSTLTLQVASGATPSTVPVSVQASGTGVPTATAAFALTATPAPSIALTLTPAAVTITQAQQSAALPIVINRQGVAGDVQFTLEGAPSGVSGTFAPNPATGSSTQLVVAVGAQVAAGTYPLTIRGAIGGVSGTAALSLTVTAASAGDFALSVVPSAITVTAGQFANTTVNIARSGGFTGAVNLTVTGLPTGVTANFVPASATGTQAQLSIIAAASAAPGTFTAVVRGNATLLSERTVDLTVTVQSGGGGGSGNVTWRFCDTRRFPLWFAYKDGANGTWTRVTPGANQTYTFTINDNVGGVAFVQSQQGVLASAIILLQSRRELQALGQSECIANPGRKTISGTVAGLSAGQSATVAVGSDGSQVTFPNTAFTLQNVNDVSTDLIAARTVFDQGTMTITPDRFVLRRDINPAAGSVLPVVDFASGEAFAPAAATYTIANAGNDQLTSSIGLYTSNGAAGFFTFGPIGAAGATRPVYGLPLARTQNGDLHQFVLNAVPASATSLRSFVQYNREITDRTITLGPEANAVQMTTQSTSPYVRFRSQGTWQAEYDDTFNVGFVQTSNGGRSWAMSISREYAGAGASTFDVVLPDFSSVPGFDNAWGLLSGLATQWTYNASGVSDNGQGPIAEGYFLRTGARLGTITP